MESNDKSESTIIRTICSNVTVGVQPSTLFALLAFPLSTAAATARLKLRHGIGGEITDVLGDDIGSDPHAIETIHRRIEAECGIL